MQSISVGFALEEADLSQLFHLPVSEVAFIQLQDLNEKTSALQLTDARDIWKYPWGTSFLLSRAYKTLMGHSQHRESIRWIWKYLYRAKHKVFSGSCLKTD